MMKPKKKISNIIQMTSCHIFKSFQCIPRLKNIKKLQEVVGRSSRLFYFMLFYTNSKMLQYYLIKVFIKSCVKP